MMQFVLSWTKVAQFNKLNHATRANKDWPSRKAHEVMTQLVKEYKPDDTLAKMEMEKALNKLSLGKKKDPNNLNAELSAIKCMYKLDLTKSKKKAQIFRIGRAQYPSIISMTQMIFRSKGEELTCEKLLKAMHNQWRIVGNKSQDKKDSDNEDEVAATATKKVKMVGRRNHMLILTRKDMQSLQEKGLRLKQMLEEESGSYGGLEGQAEKKAKKTFTAATAFEDEDKMVLNVIDLQKDNSKLSCFDMNDAFNMAPINKDIVCLNNFEESDDEESDDKESDDEESDDKTGCHEESDVKEGDSNHNNLLVTVLDDSTIMDLEVSNEDTYNLDFNLSAVTNVIADATFTTGAHIIESQDIWIADTGATSHVTKHAEGRTKHRQTSVRTLGFSG